MKTKMSIGWLVKVAGKDASGKWHERSITVTASDYLCTADALAKAKAAFELSWPELRFKHAKVEEPVWILTTDDKLTAFRELALAEIQRLADAGQQPGEDPRDALAAILTLTKEAA